VKLPNDTKQVSAHLAHLKSYRPRRKAPAPEFDLLSGMFLGKPLPLPELEESSESHPHISLYDVDHVVGHRRGQGRRGIHDFVSSA